MATHMTIEDIYFHQALAPKKGGVSPVCDGPTIVLGAGTQVTIVERGEHYQRVLAQAVTGEYAWVNDFQLEALTTQ